MTNAEEKLLHDLPDDTLLNIWVTHVKTSRHRTKAREVFGFNIIIRNTSS